ncbi:putative nucleotidyltransferase-like protein [Luteibacter rhizovicinus]|uniref:Putative nucleotidyltransferase-like protein n=1 Tax=Luteibacter rhizovicinus TaxID=242606 RepID=A0A4R3YXA3_9GAMM|nr:nucleotidyltransferase family protein [Luteibacter rhizovicinus]TCV97805.1 putative nucleotidyltransferase-like protein [Luteibacter rhizovicinus]
MLPPLGLVRKGLHRTTEALAEELAFARPGAATPDWNELEWQLASAAAAAHGISPLLSQCSTWRHPAWTRFLVAQREHVEHRHRHIASLLERIDASARVAGLPIVPLKGSALHAIGLYAAGDRPMADIDLLVRDADVDAAIVLLTDLGYVESFVQWKHRVFKPAMGEPILGLGEHRDTPVNIELHTRIQERLPISTVDITERIYPADPRPGLNPYPSNGALMSHLLLHAAGNLCGRSVRLIHLNDISLLATRMVARDWEVLWAGGSPWWALPPLRLVSRYYRCAVPLFVLARLQRDCPLLLRMISRGRTLTQASCSALWLHALPGIEWAQSLREAGRCLHNRFRPSEENIKERADMVRTQLWLKGQSWVTLSHGRRILTRLTRPVPRMDTLYVVRAALEYGASST